MSSQVSEGENGGRREFSFGSDGDVEKERFTCLLGERSTKGYLGLEGLRQNVSCFELRTVIHRLPEKFYGVHKWSRISGPLGDPLPAFAVDHSWCPITEPIIPFSAPHKAWAEAYIDRASTTHAFPSTEASPVPPPLSFARNDEDQRTAPNHSVSPERSIIHKHPSKAHDPQRTRQLGKELVWLQDPVKLAENTIGLLRNDDHEKAIDTVRMASKNTSCTVSWNHLIDYDMSKGKVQKAVKIYNEVRPFQPEVLFPVADPSQMKKRGQQPDAQTYTILLRGLSWHPHLQESLPRALKIYHSMSADNCPVKPNIIHTNTVLKVCALAKDMDALWGVAAKLPTRGMGASNNLTFTIILNAIRSIAWQNDKDLPDESLDEKSLRRQRAVVQGRKMWEEIIPRWRAGDMWIDEELVCAMGRLLLLGSTERDFDDILSLAEQVMGIPRQKRKLSERDELEVDQPVIAPRPVEVGAPGPGGITAVEKGKVDPPGLENDESTSPPSASDTTLTPALTNVFRPASSSKIPSTSISTPRPGRNTLSLLLDACISLRAIPSAQSYWGLLTSPTGPYNIAPDSENYHMYLRLLRVQRASSLAADLVEDMHSGSLADMRMLATKTFRIALSCCARDKNNVHATAHATRILHTMFQTLPYPDPRAMEMFTQLLLAVARTDFRVAVKGLQAMDPGMMVLNRAGNYGGGVDRRREVLQLAQRFVGACDAVVGYAGDRLEREERKWLLQRKLMW
ncbi:MAG: hypothetical protein Q9210_007428, partial [Variospora velana]